LLSHTLHVLPARRGLQTHASSACVALAQLPYYKKNTAGIYSHHIVPNSCLSVTQVPAPPASQCQTSRAGVLPPTSPPAPCQPSVPFILPRVGQNCIYTYIYTVYLVISKPKIPYVHRIYMVLANPNPTPLSAFCPTPLSALCPPPLSALCRLRKYKHT
jgi:hypothetical protein